MEVKYSSETFNRLHGVILQIIELFLISSVRTSNPALSETDGKEIVEIKSDSSCSEEGYCFIESVRNTYSFYRTQFYFP
jgi:hypothetical protein